MGRTLDDGSQVKATTQWTRHYCSVKIIVQQINFCLELNLGCQSNSVCHFERMQLTEIWLA